MRIEQFVELSEGEWKSMRSGHSLAFQQFEQVVSKIKINSISPNNPEVLEILNSTNNVGCNLVSPFRINWQAESDWDSNETSQVSNGVCILIPIPISSTSGKMLRSVGYAEEINATSNYCFLSDGTLTLTTNYDQTIAEERIWFVSNNVRCRSSVIRTLQGSGILQTSYASEIRKLKA